MPDWQRSSRCGNTTCVEVLGHPDGTVRVRNSKHPDREPLTFSAAEWEDFRLGVLAGEFRFGGDDHAR